ncbi:LacI family DNA-binding transcriptional regulator [Cellulomonas soli]|uniref:LacI family transcriptional regulator n=1 Tax=Cellulomonas soli TaxID=931535 RepID=A0A512P8E4_9CELL|nr:LacI family DNA-binding transcriptional regulator [Cellulomonas soli]NYI57692.1 DNA-binding LacI/PurR family transcriptional regulator [Cellulomonas soli]GEP67471.1 LacI family transcriptional regulator [Cellulomonas soli]
MVEKGVGVVARARVTAKDVARQAGVSQSTVSYVLNDTPNQKISEATRARVLAAAEEMRYAPSAAARALRLGASRMVLAVLPDAPIGSNISMVMDRLSDDLEPHGYSVVYRRHRGSAMLERAWREVMPAALVNLAAFSAEDEEKIEAAGIVLVRAPMDDEGPGKLSISDMAIGRLQAAHLLERGHRRLGYAAPVDQRVFGYYGRRIAGVREVCAAARVPEPVVVPLPLDVTEAAAAVAEWMSVPQEERITAVCAYNDEQAFALLAGMRVLGLSAPHDLAVVGVDNVQLSPFAHPALTTVDIHSPAIADLLSQMVLTAITGGTVEGTAAPRATLVRRDSA